MPLTLTPRANSLTKNARRASRSSCRTRSDSHRKGPSRGESLVKAPEVTPRNSVGRVKVPEMFTLNYSNYHPDRTSEYGHEAESFFVISGYRHGRKIVIRKITVETIIVKIKTDKRGRENFRNVARLFSNPVNNYARIASRAFPKQ